MSISLFDLHCDTSFALLGKNFEQMLDLRSNRCHIDLERASAFSKYVQCFACYTTPLEIMPEGITPVDVLGLEYEHIMHEIKRNHDMIRLAKNSADIQRNCDDGVMSAVLTLEGSAGYGYDPAALEELYEKGFRIATLGWNEKNCLVGSHCSGGGLTEKGKQFVREAQRLGIIIDVSHMSDEGFWDVMDIAQAPVIASHSNSREICSTSRNLTDPMFSAICETGGIVGINLYADFLGEVATLDTVCDHILHFLELDRTGDHIALGGDLDGCDKLPVDFSGIESYPSVADRLLDRGLDAGTVNNIFWNNAMRVFERCCM